MPSVATRRNLAFAAAFGLAALFLAYALTIHDPPFDCWDTALKCLEPPPSGEYSAHLAKNFGMTVLAFLPAIVVIRWRENGGHVSVVASMVRWTVAVFAVGAASYLCAVSAPDMYKRLWRLKIAWLAYGDGQFARIDVAWFGLYLLVSAVVLGPVSGAIYGLARRCFARTDLAASGAKEMPRP